MSQEGWKHHNTGDAKRDKNENKKTFLTRRKENRNKKNMCSKKKKQEKKTLREKMK